MTSNISASKLQLLSQCTASAFDIREIQISGPAANLGNAFHELAEFYVTHGQMDEEFVHFIGLVQEKYNFPKAGRSKLNGLINAFTSSNEVRNLINTGVCEAETAFAYSPIKNHTIKNKTDEHRDYTWVPTNYIPGTADLIVRSDENLQIIDWKTGQKSVIASNWMQGKFLAVAASNYYCKTNVTIKLVYVRATKIEIDSYEINEQELENTRQDLIRISNELLEGELGVQERPGSHCSTLYCPRKAYCEALRRMNDVSNVFGGNNDTF